MAKQASTPEATPAETKPKPAKEPRFTPMTPEAATWVAAHARPAVSDCLCGCGGSTKGRFVPGHDALLKETLKATIAGGTDEAKAAASAALATFGW